MATTLTLTELIAAVRQRSDTENSLFVTDSELTSYINQSYQELYDVLVQKYGNDYFVSTTPYSFTTDGTNDHFALPSDFQKGLGVDLSVGANQWMTLKPFMMAERNNFNGPTDQFAYGASTLRYRFSGSKIWLTPFPASGQTLRIFYIPRLVSLVSGSDTADNLGGWLEYVIVDAAIKAMQKEESDVSVLFAQKQALVVRIEAAAENRDAGSPQTVSDSRSNSWNDDDGGFWS